MKISHAKSAAGLMSLFCALSVANANAALLVTTSDDAGQLVSALISGSGFSVSSPLLTSGTINGAFQQGTFVQGISAGIGLAAGVILTSGDARLAPGPNNNPSATAQVGGAGDSQLAALLGRNSTLDANMLEFTFSPAQNGKLRIHYVFASEHYNEHVNTEYNDGFGLFVDGVNRALASISTINCGNSSRGVAPVGPGQNCGSFVNNDFDPASALYDIQYDGFTKALEVAIDVISGRNYFIKLSIADASNSDDDTRDSAVFLAGKFEIDGGVTPAPEPASLALTGIALFALGAARRRARTTAGQRTKHQ